MHLSKAVAASLLGCALSVCAQQFNEFAGQSYHAMGLSAPCVEVLNTKLEQCDATLFFRTDLTSSNIVNVLPREDLDRICQPKCRQELSALRASIIEACTAPEDVMRDAGNDYPPSLFADKFAYTYDVNCYKEESSSRFCDELRAEWNNGSTKFDHCHACFLGPLATMISTPLGVRQDRIDTFNKAKKECENTRFEPKIATSYIQAQSLVASIASVEEMPDTRVCARWYTLQEGDTCASISSSQKIPTLDLVGQNSIDINCEIMPKVGTKLCLKAAVDVHTIRPGDTCEAIAKQYSITEVQFRALNKMIDAECSNIERWVGYVACVGPRSLFAGSARSGNFPEFSSNQNNKTIPINPLKPLAPGSSSQCDMFVNGRALVDPDLVAVWGDEKLFMNDETIAGLNRCLLVVNYNGVPIERLKALNPSLNEHKCTLDGRYSYCLAEKGGPKPDFGPGWERLYGLRWG